MWPRSTRSRSCLPSVLSFSPHARKPFSNTNICSPKHRTAPKSGLFNLSVAGLSGSPPSLWTDRLHEMLKKRVQGRRRVRSRLARAPGCSGAWSLAGAEDLVEYAVSSSRSRARRSCPRGLHPGLEETHQLSEVILSIGFFGYHRIYSDSVVTGGCEGPMDT